MTSTLRPSPSAPIFTNLKIQATRSPRSKDTPENARMARRPQNLRQSPGEHAIAMIFGDFADMLSDCAGHRTMAGNHHLAEILGIELEGQSGCLHEAAGHDRY